MLQCELDIPESSKLSFEGTPATNALTVGAEFSLRCDGQWPEAFREEGAAPELVIGEDSKDALRLLDFKWSEQGQAELVMTSYVPGDHLLNGLKLKLDGAEVELDPVRFTVASVINPQEPPEGPYGPQGPFKLVIPLAYWLILLAVLTLLGLTIGIKLYRRSKRKKLMAELRISEAALAPAAQFFQSLRRIQREYPFFSGRPTAEDEIKKAVTEVDEAFRYYLARIFDLPAPKWSIGAIISDLKKRKLLEPEILLRLKKDLNELERAKGAKKHLADKDAVQLIELVRHHVDQLEALNLKGKGD